MGDMEKVATPFWGGEPAGGVSELGELGIDTGLEVGIGGSVYLGRPTILGIYEEELLAM